MDRVLEMVEMVLMLCFGLTLTLAALAPTLQAFRQRRRKGK